MEDVPGKKLIWISQLEYTDVTLELLQGMATKVLSWKSAKKYHVTNFCRDFFLFSLVTWGRLFPETLIYPTPTFFEKIHLSLIG